MRLQTLLGLLSLLIALSPNCGFSQGLLPIGPDDVDEALLQPLYVKIKAVDKRTGDPLPKVQMTLKTHVANGRYEEHGETNDAGECRLDLPKSGEMSYVSIEGKRKSFVPIYYRYDGQTRKLNVPEEVEMVFEPSASIGGVVQDESGEPLSDVKVEVYIPATRSSYGNSFVFHVTDTRTDKEGRWRSDFAPQDMSHLNVSFEHPDYLNSYIHGSGEKASLLAFDHVKTLSQGGLVRGRVLDEAGLPIAGARLLHGSSRFGSDLPRATTDEEGKFTIKNCKSGVMPVTVQADGYAPDLRLVSVAGNGDGITGALFRTNAQPTPEMKPQSATAPIEFRLKAPGKVRGRVVDPAGNPLSGVGIAADTWRGHRALEWQTKTDAEGRFSWDNAPPIDEVQYDLYARNRMSIRNKVIPADGEEHTLVMLPEITLKGQVSDAATGESIPTFRVIYGYKWREDSSLHWNRERGENDFQRGEFELVFDEPQFATKLLVEAPGYKPYATELFHLADGDREFDIELEKGKPLTGQVVDAGGKPVADAGLALLSKESGNAGLEGAKWSDSWSTPRAETDGEGNYQFPEQNEPVLIVAVSKSGIGGLLTDRLGGELPTIKLTGWGRVEGRLMVGDKPAVGERINVNHHQAVRPTRWVNGVGVVQADLRGAEEDSEKATPADAIGKAVKVLAPAAAALFNARRNSRAEQLLQEINPNVWQNVNVNTDKEGRFAYPYALPGDFKAYRFLEVNRGNGSTQYPTHSTPGAVEAGGVTTIEIGGVGRPLVGQIATPTGAPAGFDWGMSDPVELKPKQEQHTRYQGIIQGDGSFRVEDVPPGDYELTVNVKDSTSPRDRWSAPVLASLKKTVTIPAPADGAKWSAEPVDLGELTPTGSRTTE